MAFDPATLDRLTEALSVAQKITLLTPIERKLERSLIRGFSLQRTQFLRRLARHRGKFAVKMREALGEDDWVPAFNAAAAASAGPMISAVDAAARDALAAGIRTIRADLGNPEQITSFKVKSPEAIAYLKRHGAERISGINDTTRASVRSILVRATESGWSYQRTEKALIDLYAGFSTPVPQKHLGVGTPTQIGTRARLIAVTETAQAYEDGRRLVSARLRAAGIPMEKRWITAPKENVCSICSSGQGDGWISDEDSFSNGRDGPPAHPACRCSGDSRVTTDAG